MEIRGPDGLGGPREASPDRRPLPRSPSRSGGRTGASDRVEISDMARLKGLLSNVPPVREERVMAIRERIRAGGYLTDEKLSQAFDKMLSEELGL